jgi:hypothetical protein
MVGAKPYAELRATTGYDFSTLKEMLAWRDRQH